jgi:hypothetical protein
VRNEIERPVKLRRDRDDADAIPRGVDLHDDVARFEVFRT